MGEWSELFEDFPEENPANYVGGIFDPKRAEALRLTTDRRVSEQANLDAEIAQIIQTHGKPNPLEDKVSGADNM